MRLNPFGFTFKIFFKIYHSTTYVFQHPGPSQGSNSENARANGGIDDRISQISTAVTQVAAMLTQANGIPIPPVVHQLGGEIPHLEASHQNENPVKDG